MRLFLTLLLSALIALPALAQQGATRYIIGFKSGATAAQKDHALDRLGATKVGAVDELEAALVEIPEDAKTAALGEGEMDNLAISFIEEDFYYENWLVGAEVSFQATPLPGWGEVMAAAPRFVKSGLPDSPLPAGVDAAEVPWGIRRVNAPNAWSGSEGQGVRVAVIDTGIDASHPDLVGQVVGGYNAINRNAPYFDDNNHGTHVSGTIAAKRDGKGVVGVAPQARLYAVKVLNKKGGGWVSSIIKGIVWCARNDVQVANLSLGSPMGSVFLRLAMKYAASRGVTLVVAAGNSGGSVGYPAAYDGAIAVAASDSLDRIADFSSRGSKIAFIAPGVGVKSSIPGEKYASYEGTSMATPHVAGLAALAVSRGAANPDAVRGALRKAAHSIGLASTEQGHGLVDAVLLVR